MYKQGNSCLPLWGHCRYYVEVNRLQILVVVTNQAWIVEVNGDHRSCQMPHFSVSIPSQPGLHWNSKHTIRISPSLQFIISHSCLVLLRMSHASGFVQRTTEVFVVDNYVS
jgi:hypothetical protein